MLSLAVVRGRVFSSSGEREFLLQWAVKSKKDLSERKKYNFQKKNPCKILTESKGFNSVLVLISYSF